MRNIVALLLVLVLAFAVIGCGEKTENNVDSDVVDIVEDIVNNTDVEEDAIDENKETNDNDIVDIYSVELKDNEGITKDGVIFTKTMKLNGYEFELRDKFEDFLNGTQITIVNKDDYDAYIADETRTGVLELEVTLPAEEGRCEFEVGIRRDKDTGEILLRSINVMTDIKWMTRDNEITEYDTHFPCGFEFLGVDIDKNRLSDLDEKYRSDESDYYVKDDAKHFDGRIYTARDDWYEYTISASTLAEDSDEYFFDYVIVESINY